MKQSFDEIVEQNTPWIFRYIRLKVESREIAEDLTQEVWLRAFRAYDSYTEDGRLRNWLMRIAQNTVMGYFRKPVIVTCMSLDDSDSEDDPLLAYLADEYSADPEEMLVRRELVSDVLAAIDKLPEKHRMVMMYRFVYDMSVGETAQRMQIPEGSVKSAAHYAIGKIRKELKIDEMITGKGDQIMECREVYKYLFMYALGKLDAEKREQIKKHLDGCAECRDMAEALEKLIPHLPKVNEGGTAHFIVQFPNIVGYSGMGDRIDNPALIGKIRNYTVPEGECWFGGGFGKTLELEGLFLNGEEAGFRVEEDDEYHMAYSMTFVPCLEEYNWQYFSYHPLAEETYGINSNAFGMDVHTAIYQAVPKDAKNFRMKRGNGFINCGTYTFAYMDRYVVADETAVLEYTFD